MTSRLRLLRRFPFQVLAGTAFLTLAYHALGDASEEEAYPKESAVDPVALNGEIFKDWPAPKLALVVSGELDGYLEPCGCAGLENQKGGLKRRHTLLQWMRDQDWPVVPIDAGGLTKRLGAQAEIKYRFALKALTELGYGAIGIGANELRLNIDGLMYALVNLDPKNNPVTSANVGIGQLDGELTSKYRVLQSGAMKIGVISVLGAAAAQAAASDEVKTTNPKTALLETAPRLAAEKCDVQILMVHSNPDEARLLAAGFPQFDMIVATGGAEEPPPRPSKIAGSRAMLIEAGHKGMYVIVIGLYDDPEAPLRYQRVPLDARFKDSPQMQQLLTDYQNELETVELSGLGLVESAHPEGNFVGSEACADCHTKATEKFLQTPHSHATDTLVHLTPPRRFDPECLSCHVTGWNPQEYFPYTTGYLSLQQTPAMQQNGCENCHGPGAAHVAAESGTVDVTAAEQEELREALRLKIVATEGNQAGQFFGQVVKMCQECHDADNSPDFDFQEYWPKVMHQGLD